MIGCMCKHGNVLSLAVLIGRGLDHDFLVFPLLVLLFLFIQFSGRRKDDKRRQFCLRFFIVLRKLPVVPGCSDELQHIHPVLPFFHTRSLPIFIFVFYTRRGAKGEKCRYKDKKASGILNRCRENRALPRRERLLIAFQQNHRVAMPVRSSLLFALKGSP